MERDITVHKIPHAVYSVINVKSSTWCFTSNPFTCCLQAMMQAVAFCASVICNIPAVTAVLSNLDPVLRKSPSAVLILRKHPTPDTTIAM